MANLVEGFQAGGVAFLTKPVRPEELLANVKTHVELYRARKVIQQHTEILEQRMAERTAALQETNRELQESEERYELAIAGSAAGIWDWDILSNKLYSSDRSKQLLGYAPDELLITMDEFWNRLHPDDYEAARLAKGSTLFLDEIGELPLELQAKLLRVLESGEFERLGSSRSLHSDARIIAATNRVLEEEVRKGRFREDLWYRLKVFPITVPPLREHPEDIPLLGKWFVDQLTRKMGKRVAEIPKRTMQMLQSYPWPGNVRELKHAVEGALPPRGRS